MKNWGGHRELAPGFNRAEFLEEFEEVVAPTILRSYMEGDGEMLQLHLGEAAFAAAGSSIKERKKLGLAMDSTILDGPSEVFIQGATLLDGNEPCFIMTFNVQQINCVWG